MEGHFKLAFLFVFHFAAFGVLAYSDYILLFRNVSANIQGRGGFFVC
ncbi:hypothetical protein HMPREF0556_10178 [Listeria grayi DSM 20601]|uniref:Uncharacterized protein n=1 Tax=Listeria grayi DSM 20601 TaxID=525367 RepID=D7UUQ3_LISGR|nr:hypothetical protein HMPREF0556_10178 [Listeria grayi DSM 20601]